MKESNDGTDGQTKEDLRAEYAVAQDSAQHHDNQVWTVTSIMWGASFVMMGFILPVLKEARLGPLLVLLASLGITLTTHVWVFALQLNALKGRKYMRCRIIEEALGMAQHRSVNWVPRSQSYLYGMLMLFFLGAWIVILDMAWPWHLR
jgi:NhaP-type Na+/H+ or K+/H+ antiporter